MCLIFMFVLMINYELSIAEFQHKAGGKKRFPLLGEQRLPLLYSNFLILPSLSKVIMYAQTF